MTEKKPYWETRDLVVIGSFTAMIKIVSFLISITGGGMNPLSMIAKNIVQTTLLIILIYSVKKFGTLTFYVLVSGIISLITMGGSMMILPGLLLGGILSDIIIRIMGGFKSKLAVLGGIAMFDFFSRFISLLFSFFMIRENRGMFVIGVIVVTVGYIGCLIGLFVGNSFSKELRHAGVLKE